MEPEHKRPRLEIPYENTREKEFCITEFMHKGLKFSGIVKQRHCDFIVRECTSNGEIVRLKSIKPIDDIGEPDANVNVSWPIDPEIEEKIKSFVENDSDKESTYKFAVPPDKEERRKVHEYISHKYQGVYSCTETIDGIHHVVIAHKKKSNNVERRQKKNRPKFLHFTLYKQGQGTMDCISKIARMLHTKPIYFGYAGTKDRRSASTQRVSLKFASSSSFTQVNRDLNVMAVGDFSYEKTSISLGDLLGNQFVVVIRNVTESNSVVSDACNSLKVNGFWNYFGLQRFGTGGVSNYLVGAALLRGEYENAVEMLLTPRENCDSGETENKAKEKWRDTHNASQALELIRHPSSNEGLILSHLKKSNKDYFGAFQKMSKNACLLFAHSFQSYIWNKALSLRIKQHGRNVCEGDFIHKQNDESDVVRPITQEEVSSKKYTFFDIVLPMPGFQMNYPANMKTIYEELLNDHGLDLYHLKRKQFVLSIPGSYRKIAVLPDDVSWNFHHYDDYTIPLVKTDLQLIKENIEITVKNDNSKNEENSDVSILNIESESRENNEQSYKDISTTKILTNISEVKNKSASECVSSENNEVNKLIDFDSTNTDNTGKHKAVILTMTLPKSAYATMALREVLLEEVSFQAQTKLNQEFSNLND